ncbi:antitoxin [Niveispirillum sp. KHB5.9]|uniref:antitoxin n=1 Tax=Niveispirillum sp. KHB5.9 TaxID=3400269 RepID=UPI003A892D46
MRAERHVKLLRTGHEQAIPIPREFELPGTEAVLRKEGNRLVIEPLARPSLAVVLATLSDLDEGIGEIADPAPEPVDL